MAVKIPIRLLPLNDIISACQQESKRTYTQGEGHCFELFHRAFQPQTKEQAWSAIQTQYHHLVLKWLHTVAQQEMSTDELADLTQDTFFNYWRSLQKHNPIQEKFEHVGGLLKYLNQCAVTTFLQFQRKHQREKKIQEQLILVGDVVHEDKIAPSLTHTTDTRLESVQQWFDNLTDEKEKTIMRLSFIEGWSPRKIVAESPLMFADTREVNRIKERVLKRARRTLDPASKKSS